MNHVFPRRLNLMHRISPALTVALLSIVPAVAAPVFNIANGTLTASRLLNLNTGGSEFDVRGLVTLGVTDGTSLGFVLVTDSTDGTDPNFTTLAFGNSLLYGFAPGPQESLMTFDFGTPIITPTSLTLSAVGSSVSPNPVTDAALTRLIGPLQLSFILTNVGSPDTQNQVLVTYALTGAAAAAGVPEPGTLWLLVVGFAAYAVFRAICRAVHV
jgi:hypothetical protein